MGDPFGLERARERREELLRETEWRRVADALRRARGRGARRESHPDVTRATMTDGGFPEGRWLRVFRSFGTVAVALANVPRKRG